MEKQLTYNPQEVASYEHAVWSRCAKNYVEGFGVLGAEAIDPLLDDIGINSTDRVLDLGTGPGLVAAAVAKRGAQVIGIDFSEAMLEEAHRLYPNLDFRLESAESLPFHDDTFDAVVGNLMLHHSGDPEKVLKEAFRVLKKRGRAGFTIWADPSKLEAFGLFFAAVEAYAGSADLPHGPLFGVSDFDVFHRMMRDAGFHKSSVRELFAEWKTHSLDPYLTSFSDWADLEAFPEQNRARIKSTVMEKAAAYHVDGKFVIPNPMILISGTK